MKRKGHYYPAAFLLRRIKFLVNKHKTVVEIIVDTVKELIHKKDEEYEPFIQCMVCGKWVNRAHTCGEKNEE